MFVFVFFLFILGLGLGSFFGVIVYRFGQDKLSWFKGRSCCDHCAQAIVWYDNIPVVSYLLLKGRSRCCQQPIDPAYPLMELSTGIFLAGVGALLLALNLSYAEILFWLITAAVMYLVVLFDLIYLIIPDELVLILLGLAVFRLTSPLLFWQRAVYLFWQTGLVLLTVELVFVGLWFITHKKGFGLGDVKLVAPLVLLMGFPQAIIGVFLAFIIGAFWGILLIILNKKDLKQVVPFGPFLIIGTWIALLFGESIWSWYWQLLV